MIGSALKKLAKEHGMKIAAGVAYGNLRGFSVTLSEGAGYKMVAFSTRFADPTKKEILLELLTKDPTRRQYRIQNVFLSPRHLQLVFTDNPGTMKKIREFLDWFIPLLQEHSAMMYGICPECGLEVSAGNWVLIEGVAHYLHGGCVEKIKRDIDEAHEQRAQEDTGSYIKGAIGAALGAVLGAVVWGVVLYLGYVASLVGLLIGWLAEKGYTLLHGKQGKGKIVILAIVIILGVVLGTLGTDVFFLTEMIADGELPGVAYSDIPLMMVAMMMESPEYVGATLQNILMGLLFAGLGVFALLRRANMEVSKTKVKELP